MRIECSFSGHETDQIHSVLKSIKKISLRLLFQKLFGNQNLEIKIFDS
jgi:hypothetical protein